MCKNCLGCVIATSTQTASDTNELKYSERLNKKRLTHVWMRVAGGVQKDKSGATLASLGVIKTAHLKLVDGTGNEVWTMPLESLQRDFNGPDPLCIRNLNIDSSQCVITLDTGASGYNAAHVIELLWGIECPEMCD